MKNILLTGAPGCGKTTIIKKVLEMLPGMNAVGFFTEEIRKGKVREGFKITSLDGEEEIMAHVNIKSSNRVGKYKVDVEAVENVGANSLIRGKESAEILIIDEIGKMEAFSELFKLSVLEALESKKLVLGTLTKAKDKFFQDIKDRKDVLIVEVTRENRDKFITRENRDKLPGEIVRLIKEIK